MYFNLFMICCILAYYCHCRLSLENRLNPYGCFLDAPLELSEMRNANNLSESLPPSSSTDKRILTTTISTSKRQKILSPLSIRVKELSASYAKTFTNFKQDCKKDQSARLKKNERERLRRLKKKEEMKILEFKVNNGSQIVD